MTNVLDDLIGGFSSTAEQIISFISNAYQFAVQIFNGVTFDILWFWFPSDIQAVITKILWFLLCLCILGLLKKLVFFLA